MYIYCELCSVKSYTFAEWIEHLLSDIHQQQQSYFHVTKWDQKQNARSIVASNVDDSLSAQDLAWYFASEGFVANFCHVPSPSNNNIYIVQFDSRDAATKCLEKTHSILGRTILLERKTASIYSGRLEKLNFRRRHEELTEKFAFIPIDEQFQEFWKSTTLSEEQLAERNKVMDELSDLIREEYPSCTLHPFGSTITGLGDVNADIDICVDAKGYSKENISYSPLWAEKDKIYDKVCRLLRRCEIPPEYGGNRNSNKQTRTQLSSIHPIRHARVPIIKIVHHRTGIKCDLSFENLLSVRNSKMIALYTKLDKRVFPLFHLTRYWGTFHELTGCKQIKNYTMTLLVITFLAKRKIVPSVQFLQTHPGTKQLLIDGWNASFHEDPEIIMTTFKGFNEPLPITGEPLNTPFVENVLRLAADFFSTFGELEVETHMICPLLGGFLPKRRFENGNVPVELQKCLAHDNQDGLKTNSTLCVNDPFDLAFNVGSCASDSIVSKFQTECKSTAAKLKTMLSTLDQGNSIRLTDIFFKEYNGQVIKTTGTPQMVKIVDGKTGLVQNSVKQQRKHHAPKRYLSNVFDGTSSATFHVNIRTDFQALFMYNFGTKAPPDDLIDRMNALWLNYIQDFFKLVWKESYNLQSVPKDWFKEVESTNSQATPSTSAMVVMNPFFTVQSESAVNGGTSNYAKKFKQDENSSLDCLDIQMADIFSDASDGEDVGYKIRKQIEESNQGVETNRESLKPLDFAGSNLLKELYDGIALNRPMVNNYTISCSGSPKWIRVNSGRLKLPKHALSISSEMENPLDLECRLIKDLESQMGEIEEKGVNNLPKIMFTCEVDVNFGSKVQISSFRLTLRSDHGPFQRTPAYTSTGISFLSERLKEMVPAYCLYRMNLFSKIIDAKTMGQE